MSTLQLKSPFVLIKAGVESPSILIAHGLDGLASFSALAKQIRTDRAVYGIRAKGVDGVGAPFERVEDMAALTRSADVIVSAVGLPGIVTADMVKPGAAVVGAGTSFAGKKLLSDLADDVAEKAAWITPRLGGVGPMTRAMLLRNAVLAAEKVR